MSEEKLTYNATMFKETFQNDFTYLNGFLRNVHRFEERTALICPIRNLSWTYPTSQHAVQPACPCVNGRWC